MHYVPYEHSSNVHFLHLVELGARDIKRSLACTHLSRKQPYRMHAVWVVTNMVILGGPCHRYSFEIFFFFFSNSRIWENKKRKHGKTYLLVTFSVTVSSVFIMKLLFKTHGFFLLNDDADFRNFSLDSWGGKCEFLSQTVWGLVFGLDLVSEPVSSCIKMKQVRAPASQHCPSTATRRQCGYKALLVIPRYILTSYTNDIFLSYISIAVLRSTTKAT